MKKIPFSQAMKYLSIILSGNKRELNKQFRELCLTHFEQKLSVKEADYFIDIYQEISKKCYEIALESFKTSIKVDFEREVFKNYPDIDNELKAKWIQLAHFKVFR